MKYSNEDMSRLIDLILKVFLFTNSLEIHIPALVRKVLLSEPKMVQESRYLRMVVENIYFHIIFT